MAASEIPTKINATGLFDLVAECDSWPYMQDNPDAYRAHMKDYYYFFISPFGKPFGYVHVAALSKLRLPQCWSVDNDKRLLTFNGGDTPEKRTELMAVTLRDQTFLGKWYDEAIPVIDYCTGNHIMDLDRCGDETFGIVGGGVHMIGYTTIDEGVRFWVPIRSKTKMSYPGMLDNTVGGTLSSGETPLECMVRESAEEACVPEEYARAHLKSCGALTYHMALDDFGNPASQAQIQYLYELELPTDFVPKPGDGEAEKFELLSLEEVVRHLRNGKFKRNCVMTWVAFLIRNGYVTDENEPRFVELCTRLHRKLDLFVDLPAT